MATPEFLEALFTILRNWPIWAQFLAGVALLMLVLGVAPATSWVKTRPDMLRAKAETAVTSSVEELLDLIAEVDDVASRADRRHMRAQLVCDGDACVLTIESPNSAQSVDVRVETADGVSLQPAPRKITEEPQVLRSDHPLIVPWPSDLPNAFVYRILVTYRREEQLRDRTLFVYDHRFIPAGAPPDKVGPPETSL